MKTGFPPQQTFPRSLQACSVHPAARCAWMPADSGPGWELPAPQPQCCDSWDCPQLLRNQQGAPLSVKTKLKHFSRNTVFEKSFLVGFLKTSNFL